MRSEKMKRIVSFLIVIIMVSLSFAACGESAATTTTAGATSVAPKRTIEDDGLPELNFDGATVNFITREAQGGEMTRESITNDVLNDAIYNMNAAVDKRLNVKLKYILTESTNEGAAEVKVENSVLSGLDEYQLAGSIGTHGTRIAAKAEGGVFLDIYGDHVKYIDVEREWWNSYVAGNTEVYGILPCVTGALSLGFTKDAVVTYFNKNMFEENGITENMYDLVKSGQWTFAKQLEMIKNTYSDLSGDGKTADDRYGYIFDNNWSIDAFWSAFDLSLISKTDDGGLEIVSDNERFANALVAVYELAFENKDAYWLDTLQTESYKSVNGYQGEELAEMFAEDRAFFMETRLRLTESELMRNMKSDYGIIPMAKMDETQDEYYTYVADWYMMYAIPKTVKDPDAASAVLEALAIEAYKYVAPAYFDKVLKGRYTRDTESSEMLEYIVDHIKIDRAWVHSYAVDKLPQYAMRYQLTEQHSSSFASFWRANKRKYQRSLEKYLAVYKGYDG